MRFFLYIAILLFITGLANGYIYPLCNRYGGLCEDATNEGQLFEEDLTIVEWVCSFFVTAFCYLLTVFSSIGRIYDCARSEGWLFFYQDESTSVLDSVLSWMGIELASRSNKRKECFYSVYILSTWIMFLIGFGYGVKMMSKRYQKPETPRLLRTNTDMFGRSVSCCDLYKTQSFVKKT